MVCLLAKDAALCLLLDKCGDAAAVRDFVSASWQRLQETQQPSHLQHALWLQRQLAEEARHATTNSSSSSSSSNVRQAQEELEAVEKSGKAISDGSIGDVSEMAAVLRAGTRLSDAVMELTVRDVVRRLRDAPSPQQQRPLSCLSDGSTAVELWVVKRLVVLVRRAMAMRMRQVLPPASTSLCVDQKQQQQQQQRGDDDDSESGGDETFRHECAVLVPLSLCRCIRGMTLRDVVVLCSSRRDNHSSGSSEGGNGSGPRSLALVINPAVAPDNNPHRKEKNQRIDGIQHAVLSHYYDAMARPGTGSSSSSTGALLGPSAQQQGKHAEAESFANFLRDASIGFDMQIMALSGGVVGYYIAHMRGASTNTCIVCGAVGLVLMLLVDAFLFMLRMGKVDAQTLKKKRRRWWWKQKQSPGGVVAQQQKQRLGGDGCAAVDDDAAALLMKKNA
ncbi:hypothetical protein DQ04_06101020 [Trypanosoma grayi]|uniref:hypothetical protein n=1 Tax=Trypanosoma grayi TaxID=71804 RepID=UPI0004F4229F|nr:hypothetical protein DQ04_06101020 [Trypanosoma grayi]KEG08959.1 hypothetical protein DQ04_06101020 [Trypanosoma grayi]